MSVRTIGVNVSSVSQPHARTPVQNLRSSKIREVANAAMKREGVLPFWFGEPDVPTSLDVRETAIRELRSGNVFYTQTLGMPELREAIANYSSELHAEVDPDRIAVVSSGTSALMIALQAIINPGDQVVAVTPLWPNLVEMPKVYGAKVSEVALDFSEAGWKLDLDQLCATLKPETTALLLNSPGNPTGWTLDADGHQRILDHCRKNGIWIITDDVYERIYFGDGLAAPSFLDISDEDDLVIATNSFSKAWAMTGWRVGWLTVPPALTTDVSKLIEFSTTCVPGFVQVAALRALRSGETFIADFLRKLSKSRSALNSHLGTFDSVVQAAPGVGGMYEFFRIEGVNDSLAFCKDLIKRVGLGLAPGIAFGQQGEGFARWCYASDVARIDDGAERLARYFDCHLSTFLHSPENSRPLVA